MLEEFKSIIESNTYAIYSNVVVCEINEKRALGYLDVKPENLNPYGTVHGGSYYTLADTCAGFAACGDGRKYVTEHSDFNYIKSAASGKIYCKAKVINRGKKICLVEVELIDEREVLLCTGSFIYYCIEEVKK